MNKPKRNKISCFAAAFLASCTSFTVVVQAQSEAVTIEEPKRVLSQQTESTVMPTPTVKPTTTPTLKPTPTPTPVPVPTVTPVPEPTSTPDVWSPANLEPWFAQYAGQYGVDKNALERIANCESHFNSNASNGDYLGMFQFSTSTWINYRNQMGMDPNPALRTNPEEAIRTGAFMMSKRGTAPWPSCV